MYQLRHAVREDLPQMLTVLAPYITGTNVIFDYQVPSLEQFEINFRHYTEQLPWIVAVEDEQIAGYAYAAPFFFSRAAYQWNIGLTVYIADGHQRKGVASVLYGCLEELLLQLGYYRAYAVITGTNESSLKFHRMMGYREEGKMPAVGYKRGSWEDVCFYSKQLKEPTNEPAPPFSFDELDAAAVRAVFGSYEQKLQ